VILVDLDHEVGGKAVRRLALTLIVAALLAALSAAPALAAIHPIVQSECSAPAATGTAADTQDPPGQDPDNSAGNDTSKLRAVTVSNPNALSGEGSANCTFPESTND
jgi:hypothetical protein